MRPLTMKEMLTICALILSLSLSGFGQCPEYDTRIPHIDAVVSVDVKVIESTKVFVYRYSVKNLPGSTGCVNNFSIDLTSSTNSVTLSGEGLEDYPVGVFRKPLHMPNALETIPVGVPSLPGFQGAINAWPAGFSIYGTIEWHSGYCTFKIAPGQTLDSITLTSHGVPGLRRYVVTPSYDPKPAVEITPENEDSMRAIAESQPAEDEDAFLKIEDSIRVVGFTIGPIAIPSGSSCATWLDPLASYKHECLKLGWLNDRPSYRKDCDDAMKNKDWFRKGDFNKYSRWRPDESWDFDRDWNNGIVGVLDKRLDEANDELGKGDSVKARRDLEIFVMEIEMLISLGKKQGARSQRPVLTAEGYALLKYNAEYLIDRLPEGHGREHEGDREDKR